MNYIRTRFIHQLNVYPLFDIRKFVDLQREMYPYFGIVLWREMLKKLSLKPISTRDIDKKNTIFYFYT